MLLRTLQYIVHGIIDVGLAKAPGEYIGQVVGRRSPLFDPTAVATMLVVTLSSGMFSSFVTVPKMDSATPTAASSLEPADCMRVSRLSCAWLTCSLCTISQASTASKCQQHRHPGGRQCIRACSVAQYWVSL